MHNRSIHTSSSPFGNVGNKADLLLSLAFVDAWQRKGTTCMYRKSVFKKTAKIQRVYVQLLLLLLLNEYY